MNRHRIIVVIGVLLLAAFPMVMQALDQTFYISFACRIMIYAVAASSLNLILGHGGMISFGHAAFVGTGAYAVAILADLGVSSMQLDDSSRGFGFRASADLDMRMDTSRGATAAELVATATAEARAIVPERALSEAGRAAQTVEKGSVEVSIDESQVTFKIGGFVLTSRLIEGEFPKYRSLLPEASDNQLTVSRQHLIDAVKRVGLLARSRLHDVDARDQLGDGVLHLHAGVHLDEVELSVFVQELERARTPVTDALAGCGAAFADFLDQLA